MHGNFPVEGEAGFCKIPRKERLISSLVGEKGQNVKQNILLIALHPAKAKIMVSNSTRRFDKPFRTKTNIQ